MGSGESSPRKITIEKNDLDGNDSNSLVTLRLFTFVYVFI